MKKRYWLRGGVVFAGLYVIWALYWFIYSSVCGGMLCSIFGVLSLLPLILLGDRIPGSSSPHIEGLMIAVIIILNASLFFLAGAAVGKLYGKIKSSGTSQSRRE